MCNSGCKERQLKTQMYSKLLCCCYYVTLLHYHHKDTNIFDYCHGSRSRKEGGLKKLCHYWSCKDLTFLDYHKPLSLCTSNTSLVRFINFLLSTLSAKCITQLFNGLPNLPHTWGCMIKGYMITFSLALFARKSSHSLPEEWKSLSNYPTYILIF